MRSMMSVKMNASVFRNATQRPLKRGRLSGPDGGRPSQRKTPGVSVKFHKPLIPQENSRKR
jgi:hypothetical protein